MIWFFFLNKMGSCYSVLSRGLQDGIYVFEGLFGCWGENRLKGNKSLRKEIRLAVLQ